MADRTFRRRHFLIGMGTLSAAAILSYLSGNRSEAPEDTETADNDTTSDQPVSNPNEEGKGEDNDEDQRDPPKHGSIVFVYDDGPMEDYTQAFPVHQGFDAPATAGIVSNWIGREDYQENGCMDVEQLEELVDAGWEIASHTIEHTPLGTFELTEDADSDDERIYPEEIRHGYELGMTLEITDGEQVSHRTVVDYGTDDVDRYLHLDEPLGESFAAGEAVVRYPADQMHKSLGESKHELENLGFEIDTLLGPYDSFDEYSMEFVPEYYDGVANARHGSRINDPDNFDPYETRRDYFIEFANVESVQSDLDTIAEQGALGVVGAHTYKPEVDEDAIHDMLSWVAERDIEILTLREAIGIYATE